MYIESGSESRSVPSWQKENFIDELADYVINFLFSIPKK